MKRYTLPCLFATLFFGIMSCTEPAPTAGDGGFDSSSEAFSKKGGKPGGGDDGFTNWATASTKGGSEIKLASFDGTITSTLIGGGGTNRYNPRFTEDGSEVAYAVGSDLRIVNVDGSNDRLLGPGVGHFDWVPNTPKVIYSTQYDVGVLDTQTGQSQLVGWPSFFSYDGWMGAVSAGPDLEPDSLGFQGPIVVAWGSYDTGEIDIYVAMVREDASGLMTVDQSMIAQLEVGDHPNEGGQNHPVFSPDGSEIAFVDKVACCHGKELWVVDFDLASWSFDLVQHPPVLLASADETPSLHVISYQPTWAPDGSWIAFTGTYFLKGRLAGRLTRVQPNGSNTTVLPSKVPYFHPDWNPAWVAE